MSIEWLIVFLAGLGLGYAWKSIDCAGMHAKIQAAIALIVALDRTSISYARGLHVARDALKHCSENVLVGHAARAALDNMPMPPPVKMIDEHERTRNEMLAKLRG